MNTQLTGGAGRRHSLSQNLARLLPGHIVRFNDAAEHLIVHVDDGGAVAVPRSAKGVTEPHTLTIIGWDCAWLAAQAERGAK